MPANLTAEQAERYNNYWRLIHEADAREWARRTREERRERREKKE